MSAGTGKTWCGDTIRQTSVAHMATYMKGCKGEGLQLQLNHT